MAADRQAKKHQTQSICTNAGERWRGRLGENSTRSCTPSQPSCQFRSVERTNLVAAAPIDAQPLCSSAKMKPHQDGRGSERTTNTTLFRGYLSKIGSLVCIYSILRDSNFTAVRFHSFILRELHSTKLRRLVLCENKLLMCSVSRST